MTLLTRLSKEAVVLDRSAHPRHTGAGPGMSRRGTLRSNQGVPVSDPTPTGPVPSASTQYGFAQYLLVRLLGALIAMVGVVLLVVVGLVAALDLPGSVFAVALVVAVVAVVVSGYVLTRHSTLVRFDETGYQVRMLRGAGVTQARWKDVEDAVTATIAGRNCVVLRLRDGRTTTLPVDVLDVPAADFVQDLRAHLDRGHGYRRL